MRAIRSPQILLLGVFLLAGLIAFAPNLNSYFLSDDFVQIGKVLHGDYSVAWGQEHGGFFRPLFIWSYVFDSRLWSTRPFGYHLTNFLLHSLNAFLVYRLGISLGRHFDIRSRVAQTVAIAAAALFLLHPSHSEAVIWISGRADLIATFFVLGSLLMFLYYEATMRYAFLVASLGSFALALLAKEAAICTPLLIVVLAISRRQVLDRRRLMIAVSTFFAILLAFVAIRARFIGSIVGGYGTAQHLNFSPGWLRDRLLEALVRSISPPLPNAASAFLFKPLQSPIFYLIVLMIVMGIAGAILWRRRLYRIAERSVQNRLLVMLFSLWLLSLFPVINLRLSLYQTLGDRFLYLPTVFACLLIAYVAAVLIRRVNLFIMFVALVLGLYSGSLYRTNKLWRDAARLSYSLTDQLPDFGSQTSLVVLNAPDNLCGVPVFHNGLPEAISFGAGAPMVSLQIVSFQDLQFPSDRMLVVENQMKELRAVNRADQFSRISSTDCIEARSLSADTLNFHYKNCQSSFKTLFFSDGRLNEVGNEK